MPDEMLDVVDPETSEVLGQAPRKKCHGDPSLVHRAVHLAVFHPDGRILLQKRALTKIVQPGKWDMSVGGHLSAGESWLDGLIREAGEELGLSLRESDVSFLFEMKERNSFESENIRLYKTVSGGPFPFQKEEIDETAFFSVPELLTQIRRGKADGLTPLLCRELEQLEPYL